MEDFTQMLKRAHIQQLRSFLMDGTGLDNWYEDEDSRPYGQRLEEEERPIWKLLEKTFPDGKALDEAVEPDYDEAGEYCGGKSLRPQSGIKKEDAFL